MPTDPPRRRSLDFTSMADIAADARAVAGGPHRTTGNWNASQIVGHVTDLIELSNRGSDIRFPWPIRLLGRGLKLAGLHTKPLRAGLKAPKAISAMIEQHQGVPIEEALSRLDAEVAESQRKPMSHPSPLFGPLSHEEWVGVHRRHAELHFSFLEPVDAEQVPAS